MRSRGLILGGVVVLLVGLAVVVASQEQFPSGSACGGLSFKADGTPWVCTFDDEFDSDHLDTRKWVVQTNVPTGDPTVAAGCFQNTTQNVSVSDGALHLGVARQAQPSACASLTVPVQYTAGQVSTYHLFSQSYGRFEARMRTTATTAPGLHEAFWLWPDDQQTPLNWPTTGEIDVAETYSSSPNLAIPYLHFRANDNGGPIDGFNTGYCAAQRGVWNTYDLTWTPTTLTVAINGRTCLVNTTSDPAFNHRYILALSGTLGSGNDALTSATPIPATTEVDYVRVWQ